jgi:predicted MPP superfamily phosphohydrolase
MMTRRKFLRLTVGSAAILGLYTWRIEPTWVDYVRLRLPVRNLPAGLEGKTLVQLSDLHIGAQVDPDYLRRTFAAVQALQPDIVAYTGDFVSYTGGATIESLRALASRLPRGQLGTVAVLGNHDYGHHWNDPAVAAEVTGVLGEHGCVMLRNQCAHVAGLVIGGVDDLWAGGLRLAPVLTASPALVLCHNPDGCDLPGWEGYRGWILAGHTHGGQCKPPFLPAPLLPVKNRRYTSGKIALSGNRTLYINRGLGHLLRVRFNVRPEVTIFELVPA